MALILRGLSIRVYGGQAPTTKMDTEVRAFLIMATGFAVSSLVMASDDAATPTPNQINARLAELLAGAASSLPVAEEELVASTGHVQSQINAIRNMAGRNN